MNHHHYFRIDVQRKLFDMSLLMKEAPTLETTNQSNGIESANGSKVQDDLTLTMKTVNTQVSTMPEDLKKKKQLDASSLKELFIETVDQKGESAKLSMQESTAKDLKIDGISQMTLHSFLLKAEMLGKNVTYTRTLKVEIHD